MSALPNDPLLAAQWYLANATPGAFDLRVLPVWADYSGAGVRVAVLDDGFDYFHPDLAGNYLTTLDFDNVASDTVPLPGAGNHHGTAILGIIGAEADNGIGGVGIAWGADLVGFRYHASATIPVALRDAAGTGSLVGDARATGDGADVVNLSFGWGASVFLDGADFDAMIEAIEDGVVHGRGGLGAIFVKSAGSNRAAPDDPAREESTAERLDGTEYTISVGAVRADGWVADFSTPGANLLVSGLSDDIDNVSAVVTTDRTGAEGYVDGDYLAGFGGTSATAAQVSGIVALTLEANPGLGWRDVQTILAMSARHVGSAVGTPANSGAPTGGAFEQETQPGGGSWFWNAATGWNGGAMHFSNDYGFGLVDAKAAVRLAESWDLVSTSANRLVASVALAESRGSVASAIFQPSVTEGLRVESVALALDLAVGALADLEIFLTSPGGTRVQLVADTGGDAGFVGRWTFGSTAFLGESGAGTWTAEVLSDSATPLDSVGGVTLTLAGAADGIDDRWVFTEAYSDIAGVDGHGVAFDGGAGWDSINAATLESPVVLDLAAGSGVLDGVEVSVASVERVVTGDGDDSLTGSVAGEHLSSGRGNDVLRGGGGGDRLEGGAGDDLFLYLAGDAAGAGETIDGGAGWDVLRVHAEGGSATWDFTGADILSVEEIRFTSEGVPGARTLIFDHGEFDSQTEFARDLLLSGDPAAGATERIVIRLTSSLSVDISQWAFYQWDRIDSLVEIVGDASDETYLTTSRADSVWAGGGNDRITTGGGDDRIDAGAGNDTVYAGSGSDTIIATDGISGADAMDFYDGGNGSDTFVHVAPFGADALLDLGAGALSVAGVLLDRVLNFENALIGGSASVVGTAQPNVITVSAEFPTSGNTLSGYGSADVITGGAGADSIHGGSGDDILEGSGGADQIAGGGGRDSLSGGDGDDNLRGNGGEDTLHGGAGNDLLVERDSVFNALYGGDGDDRIYDGASAVLIDGGAGNDFIKAGDGANRVIGGDGADYVIGGRGADSVDGGPGDDTVKSGGGDDTIAGGAGVDVVYGGAGRDSISGGADDDFLQGDGDADRLEGGAGDDRVAGGAGRDVFVFAIGFETDRILDFSNGLDLLDFSGHAGVGSFDDLSIRQVETRVVILDGGGGRIILYDAIVHDIDAGDFVFA